jgi:hypothetical protein
MDKISTEDLQTILLAKERVNNKQFALDKAELELSNLVLRTYIKYKLSNEDHIDINNGNIVKTNNETKSMEVEELD